MRSLKLRVERVPVTKGQWMAEAYIVLGWHGRDKDGDNLLSAECRSAREVQYWAHELIKELRTIKRKAGAMAWDNHPSRQMKG